MVKRVGKLWDAFISYENLFNAYRSARKGKGKRNSIKAFEEDVEGNLLALQQSLIDGTWHPSEYRFFQVRENGKTRDIASLPFYPDRIVHWAIMNVTQHIFERNLIGTTYASIPKRGTHSALKKLNNYLKEGVTHCFKMDVEKYFPSIDKDILMSKIERRIKDKRVLEIFARIIYEYPQSGIPIGNYTSQFFANLYLSDIDHRMKEVHGCKYYLRYMDDIIILGHTSQSLHTVRHTLQNMLESIGLRMKRNWQVFPIESRGVDFVGYVSRPTHILLRKRVKLNMIRAMSEIPSSVFEMDIHDLGRLTSYVGILGWCDSHRLFNKYIHSKIYANN